MVSNIQSSNSISNLYKIGNVGEYSRNIAKTAIADPGNTWSKVAGGINGVGWGALAENQIQNTSTNTLSFAADNAKKLSDLKNASHSLALAANNFGASTLRSSDSSILEASGLSYSSSTADYAVSVENIATTHQVQTQELNKEDPSVFDTGTNTFTIETEKDQYQVSFDVEEDESNFESLTKIAEQINKSEAGVTARVSTEDGSITLQITSTDTGSLRAFSITSGTTGADALEKLQLHEVQSAQDAIYTVNGQKLTSSTNTVGLPDGRAGSLTFKDSGDATVERTIDTSSVIAAANDFAQAYNSTVEHLASNTGGGKGTDKALGLVDTIGRLDGRTYTRLAAMGITLDEEGMQINEQKLSHAIQNNSSSVKSTLGGHSGVAERTQRGADEALRIPDATYTDFSQMKVENSLIDSLLPQQSGLLFDLYR